MGQTRTLKNQIKIISGPETAPPPKPTSLSDKTPDEAIAEYKALLSSVPEAVIRKAWFTMAHLVLQPGSKVIDIGSGDGALIFAMAVMNPDYHFTGVDIDRHLVRQARDLYQLDNLEFVCGNMADALFPESSVDAVIHSFSLHEVYSQTNCNEGMIEEILENHMRWLKVGGLLFIRDFSLPESSYVLLEMPDEPSHPEDGVFGLSEPELLIQYSEKARPRDDIAHCGFYLEELPPRFPQTRLFRLPYKWAYEFILRKDDREYWGEELHKEYAFMTERDMRRLLKSYDARLLYSAPHWDPQIIKARFEKKFKLFDENGKLMGNPPTSFITLAQKVGEKKSLLLTERKPSRAPNRTMRITAMRDELDGRIHDVVCRDQEIVELLPYRIDNERLYIYIHDGLPRGLVNAVPRNGPNIDGKRWSGHMTEAIAIPYDVFESLRPGDTKSTFNFARDFLGLKIIPGKEIEEGPGFYPAPDHIDERIQTKYLQVQRPDGPLAPRHILSEIGGFSTQGKIIEMDAQRVLNAIGVGLIPSSRLEIQILALYEKLNLPYEAWAECPLNLQTEEPEEISRLKQIVDKLAQHDSRFREIRGTGGQIRTAHSVFVDEGQVKGGIASLASREIEFFLHEDKSQNTAVILPLTQRINGEVMAGIIEDYLPVPQRYKGNGYLLTCPSLSLPKEITNFELARKYIAEKFEVPIECVSRMGESYFSHVGVTPQRIYPFAVSTAGVKGWMKAGRTHGAASFTPLYNLWKMLYWDNHDSFLKIAAYAIKVKLGQNNDLTPSNTFARKLADAKAIPTAMRSTQLSTVSPPMQRLDRDS
ncbi:MAG: class I SAM-dependent methyltransferase [Micavibrio aeruginosavorus]|uniref:Class I SAM-dependent methyltransferase n=1 Tax=Micavibrio aeruginosavorus TaxID=349221 RepID=A0A2W5N0B4_9BACT|nr:MAG: class I SAM-dependent methyltransferase [Micavibrio aeruginosavorus]